MRARIRFDKTVPREVRDALKPILKRWRHLIPSWCHSLEIHWSDDSDDGVVARTLTQLEYRNALIQICPIWLRYPDDQREKYVVHELLHVVLAPAQDFAANLIKNVVPEDDKTREWIENEERRAFEMCVCDLQTALTG